MDRPRCILFHARFRVSERPIRETTPTGTLRYVLDRLLWKITYALFLLLPEDHISKPSCIAQHLA
jgi:hypothetical protein